MKRPTVPQSITVYPRLATRIWVQAQIRLCDIHAIPLAVVRQGDPQAGAVVVRIVRGREINILLRRHTLPDGTSDWMTVGGTPSGSHGDKRLGDKRPAEPEGIPDAAVNAYLEKEIQRDPDLWVIEAEDLKARYWPDRPIKP